MSTSVCRELVSASHPCSVAGRESIVLGQPEPTIRAHLVMPYGYASRQSAQPGRPIKPTTSLKFHKALVDRKYRLLFSSSSHCSKPGPNGPSMELIAAIVELKRRNPTFCCVRIAQQFSHFFGVYIDKNGVHRALTKHYRPDGSETNGPSWLTFIANVSAVVHDLSSDRLDHGADRAFHD